VWRVQLLGYPTNGKGLSKLGRLPSLKSLFSVSESKGPGTMEVTSSGREQRDDRMVNKYLVVTVVDEMGSILGRSAHTRTGQLLSPVHTVGGSLGAPRYTCSCS